MEVLHGEPGEHILSEGGSQRDNGRKVKPLAMELIFMSETLVTAGYSMTGLGS